jgi:hypothetical protein
MRGVSTREYQEVLPQMAAKTLLNKIMGKSRP